MQEFVTRAIVLQKQSQRDLDGRYIFFTERYGKVAGKAKSSRKITSKLAPHLEPGNVIKARFIEMNGGGQANGTASSGTQIVDALKEHKLATATPNDLQFLSTLLPDAEPDAALWNELTAASAGKEAHAGDGGPRNAAQNKFPWRSILKILGWDPAGARCANCGAKTITSFYIPRQEFFCAACASKLPHDEVLSIGNGI